MTRSDLTIQSMFDELQNQFGPFQDTAPNSGGSFEDVPALVLDTEFADEARFDDLPEIVRQATARSTALLAA